MIDNGRSIRFFKPVCNGGEYVRVCAFRIGEAGRIEQYDVSVAIRMAVPDGFDVEGFRLEVIADDDRVITSQGSNELSGYREWSYITEGR